MSDSKEIYRLIFFSVRVGSPWNTSYQLIYFLSYFVLVMWRPSRIKIAERWRQHADSWLKNDSEDWIQVSVIRGWLKSFDNLRNNFRLLLQWSWKWRPTLVVIRLIFSDLVGFASVPSSTASESIVFGLADLTQLLRFLKPQRNDLNHLVIVLWSTVPSSFVQPIFRSLPWR